MKQLFRLREVYCGRPTLRRICRREILSRFRARDLRRDDSWKLPNVRVVCVDRLRVVIARHAAGGRLLGRIVNGWGRDF